MKSSREELIFFDYHERCHATIVDKLPEKTNKRSNGYGYLFYLKIGKYEYEIYRDRDRVDCFGFYAVESEVK